MADSIRTPKGARPAVAPDPHTPASAQRSARRWSWAYHKIRSLECGPLTAAWRATRFALFGSTGRFLSRHGWTKLRRSDD
ncbi:hypothetical protein ACFPTX_07925 [Pseudomonas sp. GCM10022188]|uniref:hypothetical protein n=1 Tax=Pseudomonas TaxID=286 RepID=UPI001E457122|nr:hypothetical protein [Pseudomonas oryzagri]MCC6075838.1 hypothetical protein [Pseudomonas oryzagri]